MRSMTVFSVLALLVLIGGGATTLLGGRAMLKEWAQSGEALAIGETWEIELPEGPVLAYYQSPDVIPTNYITLRVLDRDGNHVPALEPDDPNAFAIGDVQGRALFAIQNSLAGVYSLTCTDVLATSDSELPPDDRLVVAKAPNSLAEAMSRTRMVYAVGAAGTLILVIVLYILHAITLARMSRR